MSIVIVDYGSGNLHSVEKAFERAVTDAGLSYQVKVSDKAEDVLAAERVVLPGVGAFADCAAGLRALPGMTDALEQRVRKDGVPFLGICVGMQLLATKGLEHGETDGLNWIAGEVVPITPADKSLKIPHMGWNSLKIQVPHPVLKDFKANEDVYFVHSYHFQLREGDDHLLATTEYGHELTAAVGIENIIGVQFHPEKSQQAGLHLIKNFLNWKPE